MKPRYYTLLLAKLFVLSVTACASIQDDPDAWSTFLAYRGALESGTQNLDFSRYLASSLYKEIENADSEQLRAEIISNVSFPLWLPKLSSHFQKDVPGGSCLTVNGVTSQNEPLTVDMRFVREASVLKLKKSHLSYLEDESNFATQARCPEEAMESFFSDSVSTDELPTAWTTFLAYRASLEKGITDWVFDRYLSERYRKELEAALTKADSLEAKAPVMTGVLYPLWLEEITSHFHKDFVGGACLTVNSVISDKGPIVLDARFVDEHGALKLDAIEFSGGHAESARCPAEAPAPS